MLGAYYVLSTLKTHETCKIPLKMFAVAKGIYYFSINKQAIHMYCKCGQQIEQARLDATQGKAKTCISCMHNHDVPRKTGFMVRDHKMAGQIEIHDDPSVTANLYSLSSRKGYGVSKGAMFRKDAKSQSNQL